MTRQKSTEELTHEIKAATDIEDYLLDNRNQMLSQSLAQHLTALLARKKLRRADVVRASMLDRAYVYQIFSGEKTPSRDKLIALAFGLQLSCEETQKMLKISGNRELYARDERDVRILFALREKKTVLETNDILFEHSLQPLCV